MPSDSWWLRFVCLAILAFGGSACGDSGAAVDHCAEYDLNHSYVDEGTGFEIFLKQDCQTGWIEGMFFDGEELLNTFSHSVFDGRLNFSTESSSWEPDYKGLEIFDGGLTLVGKMERWDRESRQTIEVTTRFRAQSR